MSIAPRRPTQERGERRVRRLLEAAEELIADRGYDGVTMSAVAERAGAAIGSLYQFFPGREALARALLDRYVREVVALLDRLEAEAPALSLEEWIGRLVDGLQAYTRSRPALPAMAEARRELGGPDFRGLLRQRIARILKARHPGMKPAERERVAAVVLQIQKGLSVLVRETPRAAEAYAAEIKTALAAYLKARLKNHAAA